MPILPPPDPGTLLLETQGLVKAYKRRRVVDGVGFTVRAGEIVGLLGPNGAGKTTSFRMTVGLVIPDAGKVMLNGATVVVADVETSNGVIHVIDTVILPGKPAAAKQQAGSGGKAE